MSNNHFICLQNRSEESFLRLKWELEIANKDIQSLKLKLSRAESEIEIIWKNRVNNLTQKVDELIVNISSVEKENLKLISQNKKLSIENEELKKIVVDLDRQVESLKKSVKDLTIKLHTRDSTNNDLKIRIEQLEQETLYLRNENDKKKLNIEVAEIVGLFQWTFIYKNKNISASDIEIKYITKCNKELKDFEQKIGINIKSINIFKNFKKNRNDECHDDNDLNISECRKRLIEYCMQNNLEDDYILYSNAMIEYIQTNLSNTPFSTRTSLIWK